METLQARLLSAETAQLGEQIREHSWIESATDSHPNRAGGDEVARVRGRDAADRDKPGLRERSGVCPDPRWPELSSGKELESTAADERPLNLGWGRDSGKVREPYRVCGLDGITSEPWSDGERCSRLSH